MKEPNVPLLAGFFVSLVATSVIHAQVVYTEDFASAPVVNSTVDNGNTNYAGTGETAETNQNEWFTRGDKGSVTHDAGNGDLDIVINSNIHHLIDLSDPENEPGDATTYTLSFDVLAVSGSVDFFAYAGGGLDYAAANGGSSTGRDSDEGHLYFRAYNTPPADIQGREGASLANVVDGTTTAITSTGSFSKNITLNDVGSAGDYLFIGFGGGSGNSLTIDNLQLAVFSGATVNVEVLDATAAEQDSDPGIIRITRGASINGDLEVYYTLSGSADASDYNESHSGMATVPDGSASVDLVFTPVDDEDAELDETIQLELTADASYQLGGTSSGAVSITDNEPVTENGTDHAWLELYGVVDEGDYEAADLLDSDGDGKLNHEEFSEGTDPTGIAMATISFDYVDGGGVGATDTLTFAPPNSTWVIEASDNAGADWGVLPLVSYTVNPLDGKVTATLQKPSCLDGVAAPYRVTEIANNRKLVVFLAEGQSNMVGWAKKSSYAMDDYPCSNMFQLSRGDTRAQYNPGVADTLVQAFQPMQTTLHRGGSETDPYVSLDFYFAREYAKDHPDVDVLIIKNARGATGFDNGFWTEDSSMDALADSYLSAAFAAVSSRYDTVDFGGILWHQGEADSTATGASVYSANLTALFARHRADAENYITGASSAPVIIGTMSQGWIDGEDTTNYRQVVDAVHRDVGNLVTNATFADLSTLSAGIHFSADQYQEMGEAYYAAYRDLLNITRKGTSKAWLDSNGLVEGDDYEAAELIDSDNDGRLNWQEYREGTDPGDASSSLQVTNLSISSDQITLHWKTVAGKSYTMWYTPDLAHRAWVRLRTGIVATAATHSETVPATIETGFYSFEVE